MFSWSTIIYIIIAIIILYIISYIISTVKFALEGILLYLLVFVGGGAVYASIVGTIQGYKDKLPESIKKQLF